MPPSARWSPRPSGSCCGATTTCRIWRRSTKPRRRDRRSLGSASLMRGGAGTAPDAPERAAPVRAPRAWWYRVTVVGGIAAGVLLRVALLVRPTGSLDSDEAIVGLMARHIVHQHDFTAFYWGQNYGGSITAVVMAAVFSLFGSSTTT